MEIAIAYDPSHNPGQMAFHQSGDKYKAMVGALGSGKSTTLVAEIAILLLEHPGIVGILMRKTLPELKSTTLKTFLEFMPAELIIEHRIVDREIWIKTDGKPSLLYYGPIDNINRYKSMEIGFFGIDEADEICEEHWLILCGRLRQKGMPHVGMLATNPTSKSHWIYKNWVENPKKGYALFRSKTSDNLKFLPEGYLDDLKANYPLDWQKRFLDGEFGVLQAGDPCFPDFRPFHVKRLSPEIGLPIYRGWDFGLVRPAVVFAQHDKKYRFKVLSSILGSNEDIYEFSDRIVKYTNQRYPDLEIKDFCDPSGKNRKDSGESSIAVLKSRHNIIPRHKVSSPADRAMIIRKLMRERIEGEEAFQIDGDSCPTLVDALTSGYQIDDNGNPRKDGFYEHEIDALGYIVDNVSTGKPKTKRNFEIQEPKWGKVKWG